MSKPGVCPECGGDSDGRCSSCHEYEWANPLNTIHKQQLTAAKTEIERLTRECELRVEECDKRDAEIERLTREQAGREAAGRRAKWLEESSATH